MHFKDEFAEIVEEILIECPDAQRARLLACIDGSGRGTA